MALGIRKFKHIDSSQLKEGILEIFFEEMEKRGQTGATTRFNINEHMLERINNKRKGIEIDLECLHSHADSCIANGWLKRTAIGGGKYAFFAITEKGIGVVISRRRREEALANRTLFKKLSDYIVDHKGFFILLGAAVPIVALLIKLFES